MILETKQKIEILKSHLKSIENTLVKLQIFKSEFNTFITCT